MTASEDSPHVADPFARLYQLVDGYNRKFPRGDTPFQIVSRLCEEAGEVASAVNHFEDTGAKRAKHGAPDRTALAKELHDVIRTALSLARYYGVEAELRASIDTTYDHLRADGFIAGPEAE